MTVLIGHRLEPARSSVEAHADELSQHPTWLFSSGPIGGDPPSAEPADAAVDDLLAASVQAGEPTVFAGGEWAAAIARELQQSRVEVARTAGAFGGLATDR